MKGIDAESGSSIDASGNDTRSEPFKQVRKQHSTEAAEDYTELVYDIISSKGQARTCDIASALGVSHVTAVKTIQRLQVEGYLETAPYKPVTLTAKGQALALEFKKKHQVLVKFLKALGVSGRQAEIDAEGIEHHLSDETLACMQLFIDERQARQQPRQVTVEDGSEAPYQC
jgi:DtxR family transcriptional regulator, manganese transport regulator